jgi:hypothetical protein
MLLLTVDQIRPDRLGWRWRLTRESGAVLADHTVHLDPAAPELAAFEDLHGYLRAHAHPDRRTAHETDLVARLGAWIGREVLGEGIGHAIVAAAPVTVRVEVPPEGELVLFRPLELAYVDGAPLARRGDVSLVYDIGAAGRPKQDVGERLRMLAVFSLPTEATALGLRRERYELARLIRGLAASRGWAVDLEVLQYGVTRRLLEERLAFRGGPDLLHLSGHGGKGALLLEKPDGSPDPVPTAELIPLLAPAKSRVRLAVVSACDSAAATVAETLGWLGEETGAAAQAAAGVSADPGVARAVARELDCAVVAMRYPVSDEFAIAFAGELYENVFTLDLPLDRALPRAAATAAGPEPTPSRPAISIATPALFGARAAGLSLTPPAGAPQLDPASVKMPGFPDEPERFVGRARVMATASAALAREGGHAAVLFHGMAGGGKTACALELAYRHERAFSALAFWQAPTRDDEFGGALTGLAVSLERQLGRYGFTMVDKIGTLNSLRAFLPYLSRLLADNGLLLVLDNLETLLTPQGTWRDPRWAELVAALAGHGGFSRTILTSRIRPADLDGQVLVEPVHALSRDESIVLARELPNLRALLHADPSPTRQPTTSVEDDRATVRRVLHLVQGHPKLLELADAAAADRPALERHLAAAQSTAESLGSPLSAFFAEGESSLDAAEFLNVLRAWTTSTLATLPGDARLLFEMLCLIEDGDRHSMLVEGNWADLWRRLERPGDRPETATLLPLLITAALVHPDAGGTLVRYRIHPGVAEAVRTHAPDALREAVDTGLAAWWAVVARHATGQEDGEHTQAVVHAGLRAAPYLMRLHLWDTAAALLGDAFIRDQTPAVVQALLPHLQRIAEATGNPRHVGSLARAMTAVDPAEAERLLRKTLDQAVTAQDFRTASAVGGELVNLYRETGRLPEALTGLNRKVEHTRRAGLGPWNQLADRGSRLQILSLLGQLDQVLAEVDTLREQMRRLPEVRDPNETVNPWNAREIILQVGAFAARGLGRWQQALDLNAEVLASVRHRGAADHEIARTLLNDYGPLLELGRLDEADTLLRGCQRVLDTHQDTRWLGRVLGARAQLAGRRGHHAEAAGFEEAALRLFYLQPDPRDVATSHHNLAHHLARWGDDPAGRVAHRLAAALLGHLTGMQSYLDNAVRALASDLRTLREQAALPASVDELAAQVEQVDGVRFAALIRALAPDEQAQAALQEIIEAARRHPPR